MVGAVASTVGPRSLTQACHTGCIPRRHVHMCFQIDAILQCLQHLEKKEDETVQEEDKEGDEKGEEGDDDDMEDDFFDDEEEEVRERYKVLWVVRECCGPHLSPQLI